MSESEFKKLRGSFERLPLVSGRVGPKGRTFHLKIGSATKAQPTGKGAKVDYIARQGDYSKKDGDFESAAGRDTGEMKEILEAVHLGTKRRNGRVAIPITMELPNDLSVEGRQQIANHMCDWFEARGHPAMAVVHGNGKVQPHLHLITAARPVRSITLAQKQSPWIGSLQFGEWEIMPEGTRGKKQEGRLFADRAQIRDFRRNVAAPIINQALTDCGLEGNWHGGKLKETGIEREAKKRVRQSDWWAKGKRDRDPLFSAAWHKIHEDRRKNLKRLRHQEERTRHERMLEKASAVEAEKMRLEKELTQSERIKESALACVAEAHEENAKQTVEIARIRGERRRLEAALAEAKSDLEAVQEPTIDQSRKTMSKDALAFAKDVLEKSGYNAQDYEAHLQGSGSAELWNLVRSHTQLKKANPAPPRGTSPKAHEGKPFSPKPLHARDMQQADQLIQEMQLSDGQLVQMLEATRAEMLRTDRHTHQGISNYRSLNFGLVALREKVRERQGSLPPHPQQKKPAKRKKGPGIEW